ncbi:hypothetical protein EVAR_91990_1, partial [Eumeta japonica]
ESILTIGHVRGLKRGYLNPVKSSSLPLNFACLPRPGPRAERSSCRATLLCAVAASSYGLVL